MSTFSEAIIEARPEKARVSYYLPIEVIKFISNQAEKLGVPISTVASVMLKNAMESQKTKGKRK